MKKKYTHLLFDLDHTIWDFETNSECVVKDLYSTFEIEKKIKVNFTEFFRSFSFINEKMWARYRNGYMKQDELRWKRFWNTLLEFKVADETLSRNMSERYLELLPVQSVLMPNAEDILNYCRNNGYRMHIITNGFEETQIRKMTNSGILHYFDEVFTSEKCLSLKPHREIYEFTLNTIDADPWQCLMIGDNYEVDIVGAQNMNIDQVFYDPNSTYSPQGSTFYIQDLNELRDILN